MYSKLKITTLRSFCTFHLLAKKTMGNLNTVTHLAFFLLVFAFPGILSAQPNDISHTFFLVGDAGEPYIDKDPIGKVLRDQISAAGTNATVLYLGDNVYPAGLSNPGDKSRKEGEHTLQTQVSWVRGLQAKAIFIPGNHDWAHWGKDGYEYILNQQAWLDSLKDKNITLLPREGCPGPVEIPINDRILLVILDTQWLLHQYIKPGEDGPCEAKSSAEVMTMLSDIFLRNQDKRIIVAGHHPVITYGDHGGVFTWKDHLFPLTDLSPDSKLYIPFPVIGSLYPLYRKFFGSIQDTTHPEYKQLCESLHELFRQYPGNFYVAGHEHALQYIEKDSVHYVVSGTGAKSTDVKQKGYAKFAKGVRGFARLDIYKEGEVLMRFFQVDESSPEGKEIFTTRINSNHRDDEQARMQSPDFTGQFVKTRASNRYEAGPFKMKLFGENYREAWRREINVPVFDITKEKGGLKIVKQGGGQQTLSLRLADSTGREYVIRSVEKYPEKAVPEILRKTFAQDLVQDQISASHPYAALVIPPMAEAVGIYHTNPKLVYIPDHPHLKAYRKTFANTLALFEERPDEDWSVASYFGNSSNIVNTGKVLEKLAKDNDNQVDQAFVLKSRLFDMVIGDWDRHDDQWRWATTESKKGDVFRPIPRDRDQAFFVNEGLLARLWSRKWALPKFEGFDEGIDWAPGFSFNARYFDRSFLHGLHAADWIEASQQIQKDLTDEAIESAIRQWPSEIFDLNGEKIIRNLKSRRDHLHEYALEHYRFLSREVDITGSDKQELFKVDRLSDGRTQVQIFKINKEGEKGRKLYDRTFSPTETKEIRLYGLSGDDQFIVNGVSGKAIKMRVIGGKGNDSYTDSSEIGGIRRKTFFYDQRGQYTIYRSNETRDMTSDDPAVNEYDRMAFQYNRLAPLIYGNYNFDDGLFIGGGFVSFSHGFRKHPFKQRHIFLASIAPLTSSYNFGYHGKFTEVVGKWNLELNANVRMPNFVNNFFGWGNESVFNSEIDEDDDLDLDESIHYYRYRFQELRLEASLSRNFADVAWLKIGPSLQRIKMEAPDEGQFRFISEYASGLNYNLFEEYNAFAGAAWELGLDMRNKELIKRSGFLWTVNGRNMLGVNSTAGDFSSYEMAVSLYHSFRKNSRLVFAARVGGGFNTGDYEFYQAQILDGKTELRGFRKTRFYGDSKVYGNFEVRVKLADIQTYLFPASFGISGFYDGGRVWYKDFTGKDPSVDDGKSSVWHSGVGGGLWFTPFNLTVLSTDFGHSKDGNMAYVRLGFLF